MDEKLDEITNRMKSEIVNILTDDDGGQLGKVVPKTGDPNDWLKAFKDYIEKLPYMKDVVFAFSEFINFKMSVKGYLIYVIRNSLDTIDFSLQPQMPPIEGDSSDEMAQSIYNWMRRYIEEIYQQIGRNCKEYLKFPNSAIFAATRDFWDRLVLSVKIENGLFHGMDKAWARFYKEHIIKIWPDEYASRSKESHMYGDYNKIIEDFSGLNSHELFEL